MHTLPWVSRTCFCDLKAIPIYNTLCIIRVVVGRNIVFCEHC
jgi:hypothetical protein